MKISVRFNMLRKVHSWDTARRCTICDSVTARSIPVSRVLHHLFFRSGAFPTQSMPTHCRLVSSVADGTIDNRSVPAPSRACERFHDATRYLQTARREEGPADRQRYSLNQADGLLVVFLFGRPLPCAAPPRRSDDGRIRNSSSFFPDLSCAVSQRGCFPRPAQVSDGCAGFLYFGNTCG